MLGISFYPNKEDIQKIKQYIKKAAHQGFKYAFTSLLMAGDNVSETIQVFQECLNYAQKNGFYTVADINPSLFDELHISYHDLSFFKKLGASAIRLDSNYDGLVESMISFNQEDLDIILNISNNTGNISNIISYEPNFRRLSGWHNFYPQPYTGLDLDYFLTCSKKYKKIGLRTAAFVTSQVGADGPHPYNAGLPTLEIHRNMDIVQQAKHLVATGLIDDIIIGNAFASDDELSRLAKINQDQIQLMVNSQNDLDSVERQILFNNQHFSRGDINSYSIRSTFVKLKVKDKSIVPKNTLDSLKPGDITIGNDNFAQYKGELNIVKKVMPNVGHFKNVVGSIAKKEFFLIPYIKPWKKFVFEEM